MARSCRYQQQWADVEALTCSRTWRTRQVSRNGIRVTEVGEWGRFQQAPVSPAFPWYLWRSAADVVVLHLPNPTAELSWLLTRPRGALVIRYHSDIVRQARAMRAYGPLQHRLLQESALILPTSPQYLATSSVLARHQERCQVVPLGIETNAYQEAEPDRVAALHARYGPRFVLFSGKHRYYKGLHVLVDAAASIDVPVVIAGDGPERAAIMEHAASRGIAVHFPGYLAHADLVAHLYACEVFVFPSVARSEAFGITIMEAHATRTPVVATRLGTGVEFINEDGKTGYNVAPEDPKALADAVNTLLAEPERAAAMGVYAQERVVSEFQAKDLAKREWQCYQEAAQ